MLQSPKREQLGFVCSHRYQGILGQNLCKEPSYLARKPVFALEWSEVLQAGKIKAKEPGINQNSLIQWATGAGPGPCTWEGSRGPISTFQRTMEKKRSHCWYMLYQGLE